MQQYEEADYSLEDDDDHDDDEEDEVVKNSEAQVVHKGKLGQEALPKPAVLRKHRLLPNCVNSRRFAKKYLARFPVVQSLPRIL